VIYITIRITNQILLKKTDLNMNTEGRGRGSFLYVRCILHVTKYENVCSQVMLFNYSLHSITTHVVNRIQDLPLRMDRIRILFRIGPGNVYQPACSSSVETFETPNKYVGSMNTLYICNGLSQKF
jgi:hypothetical protein